MNNAENSLSTFKKNIIIKTFIISAILIAIGIFLKQYFFSLGILIGFSVASINFHLLAKSIEIGVKFSPDEATVYARKSYLFRMLFMGVSMIVVIKFLGIASFYGSAIGLILISTQIKAENLLNFFAKPIKNEKTEESLDIKEEDKND